jgi:hypothetical protein
MTLPDIMRKHLKVVGMPKSKIKRFIQEVMSSEEKKAGYMKVIEEYNRERAR